MFIVHTCSSSRGIYLVKKPGWEKLSQLGGLLSRMIILSMFWFCSGKIEGMIRLMFFLQAPSGNVLLFVFLLWLIFCCYSDSICCISGCVFFFVYFISLCFVFFGLAYFSLFTILLALFFSHAKVTVFLVFSKSSLSIALVFCIFFLAGLLSLLLFCKFIIVAFSSRSLLLQYIRLDLANTHASLLMWFPAVALCVTMHATLDAFVMSFWHFAGFLQNETSATARPLLGPRVLNCHLSTGTLRLGAVLPGFTMDKCHQEPEYLEVGMIFDLGKWLETAIFLSNYFL